MGKPLRQGAPVKIIAGLIFGDDRVLDTATMRLTGKVGPIDLESASIPFEHTIYYKREMGSPLKRKFFAFKNLKRVEGLHRLKLATNAIEKGLSDSGRRRVNIDPGYVAASKLVLFSTKDFTHRLYLGGGVFAEVTLYYKDGSYRAREWTYPDYRTNEYITFFNGVRERYLSQLKMI